MSTQFKLNQISLSISLQFLSTVQKVKLTDTGHVCHMTTVFNMYECVMSKLTVCLEHLPKVVVGQSGQ